MSDRNEEVKNLAEAALTNEQERKAVVEQLAGGSRRERQIAASALGVVAKESPQLLEDYVNDFIEVLNRPEAQTRWESLEILARLINIDSRTCSKAIPEAEAALFDEDSGPVRLAAMRFLCALGATTQARSEKVWPLIDEGIQCYHGDLEFNDMLMAIIDFSSGKLSADVKEQLKNRMTFDATNGKGTLQRRAQQILDNLD